jgi:hypothetical protein
MSLTELLLEGGLRPHKTLAKEAADLFRIADRDSADAAIKELSTDRRFATVYNAAWQLATISVPRATEEAGSGEMSTLPMDMESMGHSP